MATEFSREFFSENRIVKADLRAAHQLREEDIARIKAEVKKLYDATEVILNVSVDESLLSGYVLQVGDRVFDNSGRHQLDQMMAGKPSLATLKTRIEDYKPAQTSAEGGVVISSADGIVQVEGMDKAVYGEIVTFENGAKGMVESVDPGKLGIMLFDGAETVGVGTLVTRSGKRAGITVGDGDEADEGKRLWMQTRAALRAKYPACECNVVLLQIGCTIAVHTGPYALGMGVMRRWKKQ